MIDTFLDSLHRSLLDSPGEPYCAACFEDLECLYEFEIDDDGNLSCPECGLVIEVKGV